MHFSFWTVRLAKNRRNRFESFVEMETRIPKAMRTAAVYHMGEMLQDHALFPVQDALDVWTNGLRKCPKTTNKHYETKSVGIILR